jgi:hypothetical protein
VHEPSRLPQLAAQVASQSGEEAAESDAVAQVRDAVDGLAGILTSSPDAPDVEPLPEPTG